MIYAACENHTQVVSMIITSVRSMASQFQFGIDVFFTGGDGDADKRKCNYLMTAYLILYLISHAAKVCDTCESWSRRSQHTVASLASLNHYVYPKHGVRVNCS